MQRTMMAMMLLAAVAVSGCQLTKEPVAANPPVATAKTPDNDYMSKTAVKDEGAEPASSVVESAMMWAEKYAKAVEELSKSQDKVRALEDEKSAAQSDTEKARLEMAQLQKELDDANAMLVEMKGELEKWKKDVLGKHAENMKAHVAELEALRKIMHALGNELSEEELSPATAPAKIAHKDAPTTQRAE